MSFKPDWVSPPGDTIRTIIETRGLSVVDVANEIGVSLYEMQLLLIGKLRINEALAGKLSASLGSTKQFWLKRDSQYVSECKRG